MQWTIGKKLGLGFAAMIAIICVATKLLEDVNKRKSLLGMMADTRGTLGLGLGALRAYLISGDENFKGQFEQLWAKNTRRFGDLSANLDLLIPQ